MPSFTIDGARVEAPDGATVLQAALDAGIYIPHVCHHPDLSAGGQCRLCMVECEGQGAVTACKLAAADGLVVSSETAPVRRARRTTLEMLLEEYDGDCPTCARNGRCQLQRAAGHIGVEITPGTGSRTRRIDDSNPFFTLDTGKCIVCGICVRTCDEIQGASALDLAHSAGATVISSGGTSIARSRCESCGECVERCPAGGLMARNAEAPDHEVRTVCVYCGVGCSLELGVRGERVVAARGSVEGGVNHGRLCVKGRYGYRFIHSPDRLTEPLIRRGETFEPATWDEALDLVAARFRTVAPHEIAVIGSSRCTNEENYLTQKFARAVMHTNNVDNCASLCHAPTVTGLARSFGTGGGTSQIAELEDAGCILVIGANPTEAHAVAGAAIRRAARRAALIVADPRAIELAERADVHLALRPGTDVVLLMAMARIILDEGLHDAAFIAERCEGFETFAHELAAIDLDEAAAVTGVALDAMAAAARLFATRKPAMIVYSLGITEHSHGTDNVLALANLAMLTGSVGRPSAGVMPMRGQNNVQGACDMGCLPYAYPGSQPVGDADVRRKFEARWNTALPSEPGLSVVEMFQQAAAGSVSALYITGMDPAFSVADAGQVQEAFRRAEFVVLQDIFMTGTAQYADVVLPAASFAEKDGTFTNLERRVQRVRKAIEPVGNSRPDWWIVCEIARRMGAPGFDFAGPAEIMDELASLTPRFAGLSFARLEAGGIQWPCPDADHPGTPRLHASAFATPSGKGRFSTLHYRPPAEAADAAYPFIMTTGRSLYHYHLAMTSQVEGLVQLMPEDLVWVHPADADALGIADGDPTVVTSRRGCVTAPARITDAVLPGNVFMTFHFYRTPTNTLTGQALDPVAKTPEYKVTAVRLERA